METYAIYLHGYENAIIVKGALMTLCEETGQSIIYDKKEIVFTNIVAVVPANALVIKL